MTPAEARELWVEWFMLYVDPANADLAPSRGGNGIISRMLDLLHGVENGGVWDSAAASRPVALVQESPMFGFELPFPPSANRYWRHDRGVTHLTPEARQYRESARMIARLAGCDPIVGGVGLKLAVFFPRENGDLTNRIKILEDALIGVAYADDKQVIHLETDRYVIPKPKRGQPKRVGYVLVWVWAMEHRGDPPTLEKPAIAVF